MYMQGKLEKSQLYITTRRVGLSKKLKTHVHNVYTCTCVMFIMYIQIDKGHAKYDRWGAKSITCSDYATQEGEIT